MATLSYEETEHRYNPYTKQIELIWVSPDELNWVTARVTVNETDISQEVTDRIDWDIILQSSITLNSDNITLEVQDRIDEDIILQSAITLNSDNIDLKVSNNDVINRINLSTEGILIQADNISIDWTTTFTAGYDPTTKIVSWWAAADINAWVTTISWWKITTNSITSWAIAFNYADSNSEWGNALDTDNVNWTSASTIDLYSWRAWIALNSSSRYKKWLYSGDVWETKVKTSLTWVTMDASWLSWYSWWTKNFEISSSGDAYFAWEIAASTVTWKLWLGTTWTIHVWNSTDYIELWNVWAIPTIIFRDDFSWSTGSKILYDDDGINTILKIENISSTLLDTLSLKSWDSSIDIVNGIPDYIRILSWPTWIEVNWTGNDIELNASSLTFSWVADFTSLNTSFNSNIKLTDTSTPSILFDNIYLEKVWTDLLWNWVALGTWGWWVTDHWALTGLSDNDHPQYSLTSHTHSWYLSTSWWTVGSLYAASHEISDLWSSTQSWDNLYIRDIYAWWTGDEIDIRDKINMNSNSIINVLGISTSWLIVPTVTWTIGLWDSLYRWDTVYTKNLDIDWFISGNIIPNWSWNYDIWNSTYWYDDLYIQDIYWAWWTEIDIFSNIDMSDNNIRRVNLSDIWNWYITWWELVLATWSITTTDPGWSTRFVACNIDWVSTNLVLKH